MIRQDGKPLELTGQIMDVEIMETHMCILLLMELVLKKDAV